MLLDKSRKTIMLAMLSHEVSICIDAASVEKEVVKAVATSFRMESNRRDKLECTPLPFSHREQHKQNSDIPGVFRVSETKGYSSIDSEKDELGRLDVGILGSSKRVGIGRRKVGHWLRKVKEDNKIITPDVGVLYFPNSNIKAKHVFGKRRKHWPIDDLQSSGDPKTVHSEALSCPGIDDFCKTDPSSSLGGRCTSSSVGGRRRKLRQSHKKLGVDPADRLLQEPSSETDVCPATCPDDKFCQCVFYEGFSIEGDDEAGCTSVIASACQSGQISNCVVPSEVNLAKYYYCPIYECVAAGGDFYDCICESYRSICEFCKETSADMTNCQLGGETVDAKATCFYVDTNGGACADSQPLTGSLECLPGCDPKACACLTEDGGYEECTSIIAGLCNEGTLGTCLDRSKDQLDSFQKTYCQIYTCLDLQPELYYDCYCKGLQGFCEVLSVSNSPEAASYCKASECCNTATTEEERGECFVHVEPSPDEGLCLPTCDADACMCLNGDHLYQSGTNTGNNSGCISTVANLCNDGNIGKCLDEAQYFEQTYCTAYTCLDGGGTVNECGCKFIIQMCDLLKESYADTPYYDSIDKRSECVMAECCISAISNEEAMEKCINPSGYVDSGYDHDSMDLSYPPSPLALETSSQLPTIPMGQTGGSSVPTDVTPSPSSISPVADTETEPPLKEPSSSPHLTASPIHLLSVPPTSNSEPSSQNVNETSSSPLSQIPTPVSPSSPAISGASVHLVASSSLAGQLLAVASVLFFFAFST